MIDIHYGPLSTAALKEFVRVCKSEMRVQPVAIVLAGQNGVVGVSRPASLDVEWRCEIRDAIVKWAEEQNI